MSRTDCGPELCGYAWPGAEPGYLHRCALPAGPHEVHTCSEDVSYDRRRGNVRVEPPTLHRHRVITESSPLEDAITAPGQAWPRVVSDGDPLSDLLAQAVDEAGR